LDGQASRKCGYQRNEAKREAKFQKLTDNFWGKLLLRSVTLRLFRFRFRWKTIY
jgi:hypothetical protein